MTASCVPAFLGLCSPAFRVDQTLREKMSSGSAASNPFYHLQKRFQRLYCQFKQARFYWALVILARKAGIVCALMLPSALAREIILGVLMAALVTHVIALPYQEPHALPTAALDLPTYATLPFTRLSPSSSFNSSSSTSFSSSSSPFFFLLLLLISPPFLLAEHS